MALWAGKTAGVSMLLPCRSSRYRCPEDILAFAREADRFGKDVSGFPRRVEAHGIFSLNEAKIELSPALEIQGGARSTSVRPAVPADLMSPMSCTSASMAMLWRLKVRS